ncbi:uncharacterized protein BO96DRAFT_335196 [Aspergillus niger CBS 101883]|uniref:Uncharacterized protein n=3 Tax=Aspergillus niger TaxID=5061 RepID=A2QZT2_ASPNC|nr:uncharacterized protein BO96DRAFT_335196 [Aspergillus niger CBS 101883]XP_059604511.1 hypothetical protein An12g06080 [Aspergillus niger]PYH57876.1 hypothetical protein BO96DRAFT_335196 [Aspergillus niger CBS 101883]RDH14597.1 hypothetical protein M747DRAFT_319377 [Aspergillus niger ATCC 13496]CAK46314.1 hypothetical protein An12g06080 [Aspergillus niger]
MTKHDAAYHFIRVVDIFLVFFGKLRVNEILQVNVPERQLKLEVPVREAQTDIPSNETITSYFECHVDQWIRVVDTGIFDKWRGIARFLAQREVRTGSRYHHQDRRVPVHYLSGHRPSASFGAERLRVASHIVSRQRGQAYSLFGHALQGRSKRKQKNAARSVLYCYLERRSGKSAKGQLMHISSIVSRMLSGSGSGLRPSSVTNSFVSVQDSTPKQWEHSRVLTKNNEYIVRKRVLTRVGHPRQYTGNSRGPQSICG